MTALAIFVSIIAGIIYATLSGTTYIGFGFTTYTLAYLIGLVVACFFAFRSKDRRCIIGAIVIVLDYGGALWAWDTSDPTLVTALFDIAAAAYFLLAGQTRWEMMVGFLFAGSVGLAFLTAINVVPDASERAGGFIALSFPDLVAIAGHMANAVLGFGAGDSGYRVRSFSRARPRLVVARERLMRRAAD